MIITVDGPSGAGKGTLCYALAEKLGFTLLDSGAIYRVTALAALKRHTDLTDEEGLAELARHLDIQFIPKNGEVNVLLGGISLYSTKSINFDLTVYSRKNRHLSSTPHFMDLNVDVINLN